MLSHPLTSQITSIIKQPSTTFNQLVYIAERYGIDHNACISIYSSSGMNQFKQGTTYYLKKVESARQLVTAWKDRGFNILYLAYKYHTSPTVIVQLLLSTLLHLDITKDKTIIQAIMQFPPYVYLYHIPLLNESQTFAELSLPLDQNSLHSPQYQQRQNYGVDMNLLHRLNEALQIALYFGDNSSLYIARIRNRVGNDYETILQYYIKTQLNIGFLNDSQLRSQNQTKTPDILFPIPLCVEQWFIRWFDSKMLFASVNVLDSIRKQIQGYKYRFDLGVCIFWAGVELFDHSNENILGYTSNSLYIHEIEPSSQIQRDQDQWNNTGQHEDDNGNCIMFFSNDLLNELSLCTTNQSIYDEPRRQLSHGNPSCSQTQRFDATQSFYELSPSSSQYLGPDWMSRSFCECAIGNTQRYHYMIDSQLDTASHQAAHQKQQQFESPDISMNNPMTNPALYHIDPAKSSFIDPDQRVDPFIKHLFHFHYSAADFFAKQSDNTL